MTANAKSALATTRAEIARLIDSKTKPLGSLGRLEQLALQIGCAQADTRPLMTRCRLTVFAADHGIATAGVSAFPQEVTRQMVMNFLDGGAAANAFATALDVDLQVIDAGVSGAAIHHEKLISHRLGNGTLNSIEEPAMTQAQYDEALRIGSIIGQKGDHEAACYGEMGIGNTSAASLVCHKVLGLSLDDLVGRGTGVDDLGLERKSQLLGTAAARTENFLTGEDAMREYGGFEIAMMTGSMIGAAAARKIVIVDGFIATAAALVAMQIDPDCRDNLVFAHCSAERGHRSVLDALNADPLLSLEMRLGEGTGALLAWPLVKCAAAMLNDMASFESAGISGRK